MQPDKIIPVGIDSIEGLFPSFEKTGDNYLMKEQFLEAIYTFRITKNNDKLSKIGFLCLERNYLEFAFKAFSFSEHKEGLNKLGEDFLKEGEIKKSLSAFKLADNKEMVEFIVKNF